MNINQQRAWESIFWKLTSCGAFAGINGVVRYLSQQEFPLSSASVGFYQHLIGSLCLIPMMKSLGWSALRTRHPVLHLCRVLAAVLGVVLWYEALKYLPMAQAVSLNFTGPLFTILVAWFLLNERLNWGKAGAILFSSLGAMMMARPDWLFPQDTSGHNLIPQMVLGWVVLLPLGSALVLAMSKILTRRLTLLGESPESIAIYLLVFMTPGYACFAGVQGIDWPSMAQWPWLGLAGGLAALAHLSFARAYQLAEVTFLMPIGVFKLLLNLLLGYLIFREFPNSVPTFLGMLLIFSGAGILAWHTRKSSSVTVSDFDKDKDNNKDSGPARAMA